MKKRKLNFLILMLAVFTLFLSGCILMESDAITLGSRNNTESIILSQIMGTLIQEKTDKKVSFF